MSTPLFCTFGVVVREAVQLSDGGLFTHEAKKAECGKPAVCAVVFIKTGKMQLYCHQHASENWLQETHARAKGWRLVQGDSLDAELVAKVLSENTPF